MKIKIEISASNYQSRGGMVGAFAGGTEPAGSMDVIVRADDQDLGVLGAMNLIEQSARAFRSAFPATIGNQED